MRRAAVALLALLLMLGLTVGLMVSLQTRLLFPTGAVPLPGPLPPGSRELKARTADGETLKGVHIPPAEQGRTKLLILGFGGNGWNGSDVAATLHRIFRQADVVAFHYRGYEPSTGTPSASALAADAPLVFDEAVHAARPTRTVAVGFSIGSGVAASLAAERAVDGLILLTPFDSLKSVARDLYPWLPSAFLEHELQPAAILSRHSVPVAIIAAGDDEIIPLARTDGLRRSARKIVFDRTIAGAGHNDLYARREFGTAMTEALEVLLEQRR